MPERKQPEFLPIGRAIVNRFTGEIAGPIAPIATEDWPFWLPPPHETLWRYMNLSKFEDMLKTGTLYFARSDQFNDPFEGLSTPGNDERESRSDEMFHSLYRISDTNRKDYEKFHRNVVFISCWHRNRAESSRMWCAYTKSASSVVITTSVKALTAYLPTRLMKSAVKYAPLDSPRTSFGNNTLFFYKPTAYAFEREFRLLRSPEKEEVFYIEDSKDRFRRIPIPLKRIVHQVFTHPEADADTKAAVDDLLRQFLPKRRRQDSTAIVR
ncbi:MAG: hypothetical protein ABMA13_00880 [Chthoniobacteraceae bacterium]